MQNNAILFTQLTGIWLIPFLFAYPSTLLKDIYHAREELSNARDELTQKHTNLENAHRQLEIIHDLTVLLQAAPDLISVQERVLGVVTTDLGFSRAIVALVDPALQELGGWMVYPADAAFPAVASMSLKPENGKVMESLLDRNSFRSSHEPLILHSELNRWLNQSRWLVIPLYLLLLFLGWVTAALFIGQRGLAAMRARQPVTLGWRLFALLLALVALWIVGKLPFLGNFVAFLALIAGIGAIVQVAGVDAATSSNGAPRFESRSAGSGRRSRTKRGIPSAREPTMTHWPHLLAALVGAAYGSPVRRQGNPGQGCRKSVGTASVLASRQDLD